MSVWLGSAAGFVASPGGGGRFVVSTGASTAGSSGAGAWSRFHGKSIAPIAPLHSADAVPSIVARALARAGVHVARPGAHILRHTAATEMLRHGVSLDHIGLVLRHRSLDVSAYYAKVDVATLRQVAQPWPGRRS